MVKQCTASSTTGAIVKEKYCVCAADYFLHSKPWFIDFEW